MTNKTFPGWLLFTAALFFLFQLNAAECPIIPLPQSYQATGEEVALPANDKAFLVIAGDADETVRYAAERLQISLQRLTKHDYKIVEKAPDSAELVFLLGLPEKDPRIAAFCRERNLDITPESWGNDGFLISFGKQDASRIVCVAAGISRGVIYGQEALTALLIERNGVWKLREAAVRDFAKIKWRSFAWNQNYQYLRPGVLDAYADARINCIELRDGVKETMYGQFGFPIQYEFKGVEEGKVLREAHRRGMFVWGVVACGVKAEDEPKVIALYKKLIELGVDGLYISFDDPGNFTDGIRLIKDILALARENGFDYDRIAYLPPLPDYGKPYSDFNLALIKEVPEIVQVKWFLTSPPTEPNRRLLESMGVTRKRGWFFNWPMGGKDAWRSPGCYPAYRPVPEFDDTYGVVTNEMFVNADKRLDSVMVWVRENPEYLAQLLSAFAWRPDAYNHRQLRRRIYTRAFGSDMVDTAMLFDDYMTELKGMFEIVGPWDWAQHCWCLRNTRFRPQARKMLADMRAMHQELSQQAPGGTWMSQKELERLLGSMQTTLDWFELLVETEFPEYTCPYFVRDYKWERDVKKTGDKYLAYWKEQLEPQLQEIEKKLGHVEYTRTYLEMWRKRLAGDVGDGKPAGGAAEY